MAHWTPYVLISELPGTLLKISLSVKTISRLSPFLKDLNCHCIDPTKDLVLNPAAWTNPVDGQFGTGAPYYNDYRQQRRPSESMSLGRVFKFREGGARALTGRMNFENIFHTT